MNQHLRYTLLVFITIVLATALTACRSSSTFVSEMAHEKVVTTTSNGTYQTLTIDEFANIVAEKSEEYTIVNVHIPYEGEVAETDMSIAYNDISTLSSALPDKNAPIILYCRSGRMSEEASRALIELGYTQVWDVPGGMNAWQNSGQRLLKVETIE